MIGKIKKLYAAELKGHFEVEESVLFSEMERYLGPLDLIKTLREEHQVLRGLISRVGEPFGLPPLGRLGPSTSLRVPSLPREAVSGVERREGEALPYLSVLDEFARLLESHIRKEERQLFAEFEKKMPPREAIRVGREIDARLAKACPRL